MNIAEIRKKAKASKADQQHSLPETQRVLSAPIEQEMQIEISETVPVQGAENLSLQLPDPVILAEKRSPRQDMNSRERLDRLFTGNPQEEHLQLDESTSAFVDGTREEKSSRRWLVFSLAQEDYALDISVIREILKPREITEIPRVPAFLLGIISLRGNIIPIFDLKQRMGLGISEINENSRIIVCQSGELLAGLLIDRITQVASIQEEKIEPPPAIFAGRDRALLEGVGRVEEEVLILLNIANVLTIDMNSL